jgi:hypothetical protein
MINQSLIEFALEPLLSATAGNAGTLLCIGAMPTKIGERIASAGYDLISLTDPVSGGWKAALQSPPPVQLSAIVVATPCAVDSDPLTLLGNAQDLLAPGGRFTLALETSGNLIADDGGIAHLIDHWSSIAAKLGFSVTAVRESAEVGSSQTPALLICATKVSTPRWRLGGTADVHFEDVARLFRLAFNTEANADLWQWKYGEDRGRAVVAFRDGVLVAHYGGMLRRIQVFGRSGTALQICDVMVDPAERGVMTKRGLMFITASTFLETHLGYFGHDLGYGFPHRRAMQVGERLGLYAEIASMAEVRWSTCSGLPRLGTRVLHLDLSHPRHRDAVGRLWNQMRRDLRDAILVDRDWRYLHERYAQHPVNHYEMLLVVSRFTARPIGVMVLRREQEKVELLDLVAPLERIPTLIDQARRIAGLRGGAMLYTWITQHQTRLLMATGGTLVNLDVSIPANVWVPGLSISMLKDRWFLMSGDTDFR